MLNQILTPILKPIQTLLQQLIEKPVRELRNSNFAEFKHPILFKPKQNLCVSFLEYKSALKEWMAAARQSSGIREEVPNKFI